MEDKDLLQLFREEGKENYAFNLIVDKYSERLYWHIRKITASHDDTNDILQNTFVKAWNALPSFREESRLYTWLYRIATNESLTFIKKSKMRSFLSLSDYSKQVENQLEADPYFNGDETQRIFRKAIMKLPGKQRAVFTMRYYDEMKYEEISEILGTSVGALKASYHHAFQKIQEYLKESV
ncbi:MAG: RNA polymerase sigma factor [Bacteroidia bacterium]|mgnify:CR=1 FL=1|jgi:RNA polymerase sigma-70 factor (ECF subfamily)|nr:RNA polymerase sigma factor [Rikenellaceae bacterium]NCB18787.1 RNA polymerase sigma factor [Bacteroidia bacterium]